MDIYLTTPILDGIYNYMSWYDLRCDNTVPPHIWKNIYNYYCKDITFKEAIKRFRSQMGNLGNITLMTEKELFLQYIYHFSFPKSKIINYAELPKILRNDKDFILVCLKSYGYLINELPEKEQLNREMVLAAVKQNPKVFSYLPNKWKSDREIALTVIEQDDCQLIYVDSTLKANREFGLMAIKLNPKTYKYLDPTVQKDPEFGLIVTRKGYYQDINPSLKTDTTIIREAIIVDATVISYMDMKIINDYELMLFAGQQSVKQNKIIWNNIGYSLKNNPKFVAQYLHRTNSIIGTFV